MWKWIVVFGGALMISGCSNNASRPTIASNGLVATPASNSQLGNALPQEDPSRSVQPIYPGFDALFGIEGTTIVRVTIAPDGHVQNARAEKSSGYSELDDAAVTAMRQSFFFPARNNGIAILSDARVPVAFHANYFNHGMWPSSHLNPQYVLDTRAFPYPSVKSAFEGLSAQASGSSNVDDHLTTFKLNGIDGSVREEWAFADMGTPRQMAIRFVFTGKPASPEVLVSAICQDGVASCEEKKSWLLMGPSFARGIYH